MRVFLFDTDKHFTKIIVPIYASASSSRAELALSLVLTRLNLECHLLSLQPGPWAGVVHCGLTCVSLLMKLSVFHMVGFIYLINSHLDVLFVRCV